MVGGGAGRVRSLEEITLWQVYCCSKYDRPDVSFSRLEQPQKSHKLSRESGKLILPLCTLQMFPINMQWWDIAPFINLAGKKPRVFKPKQGDFEPQTQFWISFTLRALFDRPISSVSYRSVPTLIREGVSYTNKSYRTTQKYQVIIFNLLPGSFFNRVGNNSAMASFYIMSVNLNQTGPTGSVIIMTGKKTFKEIQQ